MQAADALCELCQQRALPKSLQRPRLRILCLHGFRQNSSSLKGRLAGLARRIQHEAELIFMDAPHHLPALYKPQGGGTLRAWMLTPDGLADLQESGMLMAVAGVGIVAGY